MSSLNKLKSIFAYISLMGFDWFIFRLKYEFLKRINYFDKVNNNILEKANHIEKAIFIYKKIGLLKDEFAADNSFIKKADEAIKGNIFSFSNKYFDYNQNGKINWQMNPITKKEADINLSWNHLPDFGEYEDIKLIWEASRFPQIYFFINAYSITKDKKYAKACISQIIDWINNNPYPKGVNYKCGQEISFRIFAWINALEYFNDFFTEEEIQKVVKNIYISLLRIEANIDYAAKSVRNNHSISEASGLFIGGLIFSQFEESNRFIKKGLNYLLKETSYQVYDDGSYIQNSFTYQRLALDVLSFVFLVANKKEYKLPDILKTRQLKMIKFLNSFMQENGWIPNYGSNDGANLFPISSNDYRDFRVSLDFAIGKSDFFNTKEQNIILNKQIEFNDGGYYILKNKDIFSFIRCHSHRNRPAQNDMFHLDIWSLSDNNPINIFCDSGSFSYNTPKKFKDNFLGVVGHNTIMVNNTNQMDQVLNFGFSNWTKTKIFKFDKNYFLGENYAYKKQFDIIQIREIKLKNNVLIVTDNIVGISKQINIKQIWNTKEKVRQIDRYSVQINNCIISSNIGYKIEKSYISDYYNSYLEGSRIIYEIDAKKDFKIVTKMEFK